MTHADDRLKALYRAAAARGAASVREDDVTQALGRSGWPDEEGQPLDRIAGSTAHADILRTVMALGPDAEALAREVAAARRPQVARHPSRRQSWAALAAGVGAAAVLIAGLGQLQKPGAEPGPAPAPGDSILSASFEGGPEAMDPAPQAPDAIFGGDFDS